MTWVRLDDGAPEHPKVVGLGDDAFALWVRALCYCNRALTDGFVPSGALSSLSRAKRPADVAAKLVAEKLWEPVDGGYQVHDYTDFQPSRAEIEEQRREKSEAKRRAGQAGGRRSGEARRAKPGRSRREAEPKHDESGLEDDDKQDEAPIPIPVPEGSPPVSPPQGGAPA
jgi:hypothetical protein